MKLNQTEIRNPDYIEVTDIFRKAAMTNLAQWLYTTNIGTTSYLNLLLVKRGSDIIVLDEFDQIIQIFEMEDDDMDTCIAAADEIDTLAL